MRAGNDPSLGQVSRIPWEIASGPRTPDISAVMSNFEQAYKRKRPALERAAKQLRSLLVQVAAQIEDPKLVRAEIDDIRIKGAGSLKRKAQRAGWSVEDAFTQCPDIVGGRVVCNNVEDVYRFEELLKENLSIESSQLGRQDYIKNPTNQGYRALHLNIRLNVSETFGFEMIPCEIQIRTRLQDAWAELAHSDIYKQDRLPEDLRLRAKDLAQLLATADSIATDIRGRVQRVTEPPTTSPNLDRVSAEALSYIFRDVFGRAPPDYVVAESLNRCEELGIGPLTGLPTILRRQDFREKLAEAYRAFLPVTISPETIFTAALYALAKGDSRAVRYVRRKARQEFEEIDAIYRREMLAGLPESADALIEELDDPRGEVDVLGIAEALGATHSCTRCGTPLVDAYGLVEAAIRHYDISGDEADRAAERIEQAVYGSGVDTGDLNDSSMCSYCAAQMAKDD